MKRLIMGVAMALCLAGATAGAWAQVPTVEAVQQEVQSGNLAHAEAMMQEVVAAKPQSAKAHYIYAEILARNGRFDVAAREARTAKQLDPAVRFTQPEKFAAFEQTLEREQLRARETAGRQSTAAPDAATSERPAAQSAGLPGWIWILGGIALVVVLFKVFTRQAGAPASNLPAAGPAGINPAGGGYGGGFGANQGYNPGYNQGMPMGRPGGGMLGTGLAAAGGFAAGMLAEDLLKGRHDASAATVGDVGGDAGNQYASDLEQRPVDFGTGGGWDDNSGGGGGSFDGGGSSDDGSGW